MRLTRHLLGMALLAAAVSPSLSRAQSGTLASPTLDALVARIDVDPDILHNDFTPAVWALCEQGLDGAAAVVPLLDAPSRDTRMHASRALSCAVSRWFGWRPGRGYEPGSGGEARFMAAWTGNGDYDWDGDAATRHASRERWATWIAAHRGQAPPPPDEPSTDAIRTALEPRMPSARACITTPSGRVWAEVTFAASGQLSRTRVHGASGRAARCVEHALAGAQVMPFTHPSASLAISIAH